MHQLADAGQASERVDDKDQLFNGVSSDDYNEEKTSHDRSDGGPMIEMNAPLLSAGEEGSFNETEDDAISFDPSDKSVVDDSSDDTPFYMKNRTIYTDEL